MQIGRPGATLVYLSTFTLAVAGLYFGQPVLMPIALATLLAFLLSPLVNALCRVGMRQAVAVTVVVVLMFSVLGGTAWVFGRQLTSLVYQLPNYKQNIHEKIQDLRTAGNGSALERIRQSWRELKGELKRSARDSQGNAASPSGGMAAVPSTLSTNANEAEAEPVPVVVRGQAAAAVSQLGPLVEVLATAGLVVVLVIFMLLRKRELRNRFIVLFGYSRLPTTTRAIDEATERISRYLLMQTTINGTYGLAVGTTLYFVGLPYALMWGFLSALLRFIPYVGPWLGASMPILLSLAVFPGWLHPFLVLGIFLVLELISNMLMEPLLYGQTVGVSEVALIVAVAFWTWLWGPIGLALATPLTVCLVVLGKYVPGMSFLTLLMGDEPVMEEPMLFYQRLLALDDAEAAEVVERYARNHELVDVYDTLILPALVAAKRDHASEKLSADHLDFILNTTGQIISRTAARARAAAPPERVENAQEAFGVPVEDTVDELVMSMLANVLPSSVVLRSVSAEALTSEVLKELDQRSASVVCVGAVAPGGASEARYLIKRLQANRPTLPVVLARWGLKNEKKLRELTKIPGVKAVASNIKEAANYLVEHGKIAASQPAPLPAPVAAPPAAAGRLAPEREYLHN